MAATSPARTFAHWWFHTGIGYQRTYGEPDVMTFEPNLPSAQPVIECALEKMRWGRMEHMSRCDEKWIVYRTTRPFPRHKWSEDQADTCPDSIVVQCTEGCFEVVLETTHQPTLVSAACLGGQDALIDLSKIEAAASLTDHASRRYCGMGQWDGDQEDCKMIPLRVTVQGSGPSVDIQVAASQTTWPRAAINSALTTVPNATDKHVAGCSGTLFLVHHHLHQPFQFMPARPDAPPGPVCLECTSVCATVQCKQCDKLPVPLCNACASTTHAPRILQHHKLEAIPQPTAPVPAPAPTVVCKGTQIIQCTHGCVSIAAPRCFGALPWEHHSRDDMFLGWNECSCRAR